MENVKQLIIELGGELSKENDAAFGLWTWLPSYKVAEKHHGDYASEFVPSVHDVLIEASKFISDKLDVANADDENREWYERCPCGGGCEMPDTEGEAPSA